MTTVGKVTSIVSITAKDVNSETKEFLLNDHADYSAICACDSGLFFTKETLIQFLEEDYFDEDNSPSLLVLEEIKKILKTMESVNAGFLFFN